LQELTEADYAAAVTITRRRLFAGAAGGATVALLPQRVSADTADPPWHDLADALGGALVRPGDAPYLQLATPRALRFLDTSPAAIALPRNAQDVGAVIRFAREHRLPVRTRGGGHGYAGYSTTTGIQVDMSSMRDVTVDATGDTADFGGGVRGVEEVLGLRPRNRFIPAGNCTGVGLAGFAQGGGFGFYRNARGLGCDNLLEADVVLADGTSRTVSSTASPDVFWAIRGGGGGNFGVITRTRVRTFPTDDPVSVASVVWRGVDTSTLIARVADAIAVSPDAMTWQYTVDATSPYNLSGASAPQLSLHCHHFGPAAGIRRVLDPILAATPPTTSRIADLPFWTAHSFLTSVGLAETGLWYVKSSFLPGPLTREAIDVVTRAVTRWPGSSVGRSGVAMVPWSGAVTSVASDATAFVHRTPGYLVAIQTCWGNADPESVVDAGRRWAAQLHADLAPMGTGGSYQNWIDPELTNPLAAYYGSNLARLSDVKTVVDPDGLFAIPQGIPVATR
jgi:FAD/FMN-containing dehydrogenase